MRSYLRGDSLASVLLTLFLLTACGPSQPAKDGDASGTAGGAPAAEPGAGGGAGSAASETSGGAAASTSTAAPAEAAPGEKEGPKDESALVLELTVKGKDMDDAGRAAVEKEMKDLVRKSAKVALSDKGVSKPRHVAATITAEVIGDKKGFSVKLGMTGVTKNGNCPLFDLDQKLTMEGGKKENPADVAELRKAALTAMFEELEKKAPTMKPNANCTPYK
jgi:hypothetical protein